MTALPPPTQEVERLVEIIGAEATLKLVEARGGTRLYVPEQPEVSELLEVIGLDAARKLAAAYGRDRIKVPVARTWRVLVYRAQGLSYSRIALKAGCTEGQVWSILSKHELTAHQYSLF